MVLLREIVEVYENIRPEQSPVDKGREIAMIFRYFIDNYDPVNDEVEINEYIEQWF
jgi:hypothetical protein